MTKVTRTLEILDRLVAFPTVSRDNNIELIDWVEGLLQNAGFAVTRMWSEDRTKAGLFAQIGPKTEGGICLSAHTDVVPVDGQIWTRPPFELTDDGDRVIGRGTTDMKGFMASALALAEKAGQCALSAPLGLSVSYDEEIGCVGIRHMIPTVKDLIGKPRLVIVGEPTSMQVATGHKGKTALTVTCHGQSGHSALAPQFVNAIHVAADFVHQIRQLQGVLSSASQDQGFGIPYSTLHVGKISGGRALNMIPDRVRMAMEFRHLVQTPAAEILRDIETVARQVSDAYPAVPPLTVAVVNAYPGLDTDPSDAAVALALKLADSSGTTKVSFGTEAGYFADLGLTTVVIGPGDMETDGHKPDEGLHKAQLAACDAMMDRVLNYLCAP